MRDQVDGVRGEAVGESRGRARAAVRVAPLLRPSRRPVEPRRARGPRPVRPRGAAGAVRPLAPARPRAGTESWRGHGPRVLARPVVLAPRYVRRRRIAAAVGTFLTALAAAAVVILLGLLAEVAAVANAPSSGAGARPVVEQFEPVTVGPAVPIGESLR